MVLNIRAPNTSFFTPLQVPTAGTAVVPQKSGKPIPTLFQPLRIRGVEFQNRIILSPMCQYSAKDGFVTPWHLAHLGGIIIRGPGLSFAEGVAVLPEGRITPEDLGLWTDEHVEGLSKIVEFAHSQGQKMAIQLFHSGRKGSTSAPYLVSKGDIMASPEEGGWPDNVWGPSAIKFHPSYPQPRELTLEGIKRIIDAFVVAAKRAVIAGFDVIEIHMAHGYLLSSFASPASNKRTDEYGGSFENRIRLTIEIIDAIREVIPNDMPIFVRVSGTDWLEEVAPDEPSWRLEDTVRVATVFAEHGVDLIDVSVGGIDFRQKIRSGPQYQVFLAAAVKKALGDKILVGAVGQLHGGKDAQSVLDSGSADVIFVGREFLKNPGQVWAMAEELGVEIQTAKQIGWGFSGIGRKGLGTSKPERKEDFGWLKRQS